MSTLATAGLGDLHRQFEQLKAQLEAEGLFDPERKRQPPEFPARIGVVTSADAAAFQDVCSISFRSSGRVSARRAGVRVRTATGRNAHPTDADGDGQECALGRRRAGMPILQMRQLLVGCS